MKWIFWTLLVLNGLYYFWQVDQSPLPVMVENPEPALASGVARLVLLDEAGANEPLGEQTPPAEPLPPPQEIAAPETMPEPVEVIPEPQEEVATPVITPSPEPPVAAKTVVEQTCFSLGPFKDPSAAEKAAQALQAFGITVAHRQVEDRTAKGFWVYLPPYDSYVEAKQTVQKLKLKGITDMFIMGRGEYQHAISLGLFNKEDTAQQRFEEIKVLEPGVVLAPQFRLTKREWLDLLIVGDSLEKVAEIAGLLQDFPGATLSEPTACK